MEISEYFSAGYCLLKFGIISKDCDFWGGSTSDWEKFRDGIEVGFRDSSLISDSVESIDQFMKECRSIGIACKESEKFLIDCLAALREQRIEFMELN